MSISSELLAHRALKFFIFPTFILILEISRIEVQKWSLSRVDALLAEYRMLPKDPLPCFMEGTETLRLVYSCIILSLSLVTAQLDLI